MADLYLISHTLERNFRTVSDTKILVYTDEEDVTELKKRIYAEFRKEIERQTKGTIAEEDFIEVKEHVEKIGKLPEECHAFPDELFTGNVQVAVSEGLKKNLQGVPHKRNNPLEGFKTV